MRLLRSSAVIMLLLSSDADASWSLFRWFGWHHYRYHHYYHHRYRHPRYVYRYQSPKESPTPAADRSNLLDIQRKLDEAGRIIRYGPQPKP